MMKMVTIEASILRVTRSRDTATIRVELPEVVVAHITVDALRTIIANMVPDDAVWTEETPPMKYYDVQNHEELA